MFLKPASRYRSVRKLERRLSVLAAAAAAAVARHDERQEEWIALHGAAEALRSDLRAMMPRWQQEFREGRIVVIGFGIPLIIVFTMMVVFVARVRPSWPMVLLELTATLFAVSVHAGRDIRIALRPIRAEFQELERQARAAGLELNPTRSAAVPPSTRTRRWR